MRPRAPRRAVCGGATSEPSASGLPRELRDWFLEHVNANPSALMTEAKYDVSRRIEHREAEREPRLLAG